MVRGGVFTNYHLNMQMFAYVHTKSYKLSLEEKNISDNFGCSAV